MDRLQLIGQATSLLELLAFASGLLSVWLAQRLHIGTWPSGIVSVSCFSLLFFDAGLYAAAVLQLVFVGMCLYGWRRWRHASGGEPDVSHSPRSEIVAGVVAAAALTAACAWLLRTRTDSDVPWPDAAVLAFSLLATWLQARGRIECWAVWMAVDVVQVPLYASRGLPLTALLFALYFILCMLGWRRWSRRVRSEGATQGSGSRSSDRPPGRDRL